MCPARGLARHCLFVAVEGEHDGFSDVGKSWDKGSSAMSGETDVKITQCSSANLYAKDHKSKSGMLTSA